MENTDEIPSNIPCSLHTNTHTRCLACPACRRNDEKRKVFQNICSFFMFGKKRVNLIFLYVLLLLLPFSLVLVRLLIHVLFGCRFRRLGSFTYLTCETLNRTLIEKYTVSSASNFNFIYCYLRFSTLRVCVRFFSPRGENESEHKRVIESMTTTIAVYARQLQGTAKHIHFDQTL